LLRDHAPNATARRAVPFLQALVVLHGHESTIDLDDRGRTGVVSLDGYHVKAKPPLKRFSHFLAELPGNKSHIIDKFRAGQVRSLCARANFLPAPKTRMVGDYPVADSTPIAEGPDWQDVLVDHPVVADAKLRLRLYDVPPKASASERQRVEQLAKSEMQLTYGIKHEGIAVPSEFRRTDDGPALVFDYDDTELPLDAYLAEQGAELSFEERFGLVQRLGEVLRFAHQRHLIHRALSPQRVWVRPNKGRPRLSIRDWYFGQKFHSTDASTRWTAISAGVNDLLGIANQGDWLYFAPEARASAEGMPGMPLDVYGFGALAYLILTGRPPAETFVELETKLATTKALDPRSATTGVPDGIAEAVVMATSVSESDRPATVEELLDLLRDEWRAIRRPEPEAEPTPATDPLDAQAGETIADRFIVTGRRGEGSSGVAVAVNDMEATDSEREVILKIARTEAADRRLSDEADVLRTLDHRRIVRILDGPLDVDGRKALLLTDAGRETLATRLSKEGRATLGQLQQYGSDLLDAMTYLESRGVFHRDIKPANLGILPDPGNRTPRLVLFDLSLASESVENLASGTQGYLDPFLGRGRRKRYDRAAELYAVATTLYEMATGMMPWWGDGAAHPLDGTDAPVIEPGSFEPAVSAQLTQLFRRGLSPEAKDRFTSADELALAWREVFTSLDAGEETADGNDALAIAATAETLLERSGLSARARSGLARLDVSTVGDLLAVHPVKINTIRGLGETFRKEIQRRIKEWRARLNSTEEQETDPASEGTERLVENLLAQLKGTDRAVVRAILALDGPAEAQLRWPAVQDVGHTVGRSRDQVAHAIDRAVDAWTKGPALEDARAEVVRLLARDGRVMTVQSLATALAAERGSLLDGAERTQKAAALLRAVYELDARHDDPLLELRRSTRRPSLVALHDAADPDLLGREYPTADVLIETATELGRRADNLVAATGGTGVVPLVTAVQELRAAVADLGADVVNGDDRRLLRLAADAGEQAAVSGFDELYPLDLDPRHAVELALSGKPGRSISVAAVKQSVATRFSRITLPAADHQLDALVTAVMPGLVRKGTVYEPRSTRQSTGTGTTGTMLAPTAAPEAAARLTESLRRHGALTLCTLPKRYVRATCDLAEVFDVDVLDVADLVVDATRDLAAQYGVDWPFVLGVDAGPKGGNDWTLLGNLVREAVEPRWTERLAADRPLLIVNAGPLVRYGLRPLLAHLLDVGNPRPAARWLLVAMQGYQPVPLLESEPVPLGPSRWITLPADLSTLSTTHRTTAR
ncbi:BREX system serine/threonine kinase PglW, partial [Pseudonocardia sp. KRD-184]|uniref:BREX system serine/threonine kinase PglW n=1 Tax=Pseudonocardia oceani TaxID=2792013 RepID=UPI001C49EF03